jgi:hypothetical protein
MFEKSRPWLVVAVLLALAGCATGPKQHIYPPGASIQQLSVQPDGQWQLQLRLQNFSSVPTTFATVTAHLVVGGQDAGDLQVAPGMTIGPDSADVVTVAMAPSLAAKTEVATALAGGQAVAYSLDGRIATSSPKRDQPFHFDSSLNPAPGLRGVLR